MNTPNLFSYATSELSQDALITWLINWAAPEFMGTDPDLCHIAQSFVRELLGCDNLEITSIECKKQRNHIDVFAIINNQYAVIIEDKTYTTEHNLQMSTYSQLVNENQAYQHLQKYCVYYKTGNESRESIAKICKDYKANNPDWNFKALLRQDILQTLEPYNGKNAILLDYRERLRNIETICNTYKTQPVNEWSWDAWQGFCSELSNYVPDLWWGTVNAKSGAFVCAAWPRKMMSNGTKLKIQIEGHPNDTKLKRSRLCIKIEDITNLEGKNRLGTLKTYGTEIIAMANEIELKGPARYSSRGNVLTLACVKIDSIIRDKFDIKDILTIVGKYDKLLDSFIEKNQQQ